MRRWVLITRQAAELAELAQGLPSDLELVSYPVLKLASWESPEAWQELEPHLHDVALLVFSSRQAPEPFLRQAFQRGLASFFRGLPVAAVGHATAAACQQQGLEVAIIGDSTGSRLASLILERFSPLASVVFPCGREHREELEITLTQAGVRVFPIPVYAMEPAPVDELPALPPDFPEAVVATSPRAARFYWQATNGRFASVPHLALGPATASELSRFGLTPRTLEKPSMQNLKEELCKIW